MDYAVVSVAFAIGTVVGAAGMLGIMYAIHTSSNGAKSGGADDG